MSKREHETLLEYRLRLLARPYSDDTSPDAQRMLNKIIREMPEEKRARRHFLINDYARELQVAGLRSREPDLSESEARRRVIASIIEEMKTVALCGE